MQSMSFQPVVADIGEQVVNIGTNALEQAAKASMSMTGLAPAGADEVSAQAAMAFHEEAAALLALNQAAQQELMRTGSAAGGAMVAVAASEHEVVASLAGYEGRLCVAGVNAPGSVVVSGDADAIEQWVGVWQQRGRKTTRLKVSHAFHSARMEPMLEEFGAVLSPSADCDGATKSNSHHQPTQPHTPDAANSHTPNEPPPTTTTGQYRRSNSAPTNSTREKRD